MRSIEVQEWFERLENSNDQETMRAFFSNLNGYAAGAPNIDDLIQLVNFMTAIRLHQLKHTRVPGDA